MRFSEIGFAAIAGMMALGLAGCGENNNFLDGIADDDSLEAKIEEARMALDRGDCQSAIEGFTEVFNDDPGRVATRLDLSAAFACRAGFSVTELIRVAADFVSSDSGDSAEFDLFKKIADAAVTVVSDTWEADTRTAIDFLTDPDLDPKGACDPAPFAYDPDAAFNQGIISTIRATMAVVVLQNQIDEILFSTISAEDIVVIGSAMADASKDIDCANSLVPGDVIAGTDLAQAINDLNQASNGLDGDLTNLLTADELREFLEEQGYIVGP